MKGNENKTAPPSSPYPWLVFHHGKNYSKQTFCSLKPEGAPPVADIHSKRIPALKQKRILSCSHGWLVLYDYTTNLFSLCNCTTFDTTPLPRLDLRPENKIDSCLLSSSPNSPDCKVLLFLENYQSIMCCGLWDDGWTEIRYKNQLRALPADPYTQNLSFCRPVMCRGKIYAYLRVSSEEFLGLWSIEIVDGDGEAEQMMALSRLDNSPEWDSSPASSHLKEEYVVASEGELYSVRFIMESRGMEQRGGIVGVEVRKLSWDSMVWERVDSLKNQSFFICPNYCFSCPTPGPDSIFVTKSGDVSLYTYKLDDESLLVSLPCPILPRLIQNYPIWMMPQALIRSQLLTDLPLELLTDLPLEVLEKVAKNLVIPHDYMNFRTVSRICRSAAPLINWRKTLSGSETHFSFPLHMFPVKSKSLYKFVHPQQNSAQSYLMTIPDCLIDTNVCYSNHGWLLMAARRSGAEQHVHLYNPFTRDIRSYIAPPSAQVLFFTSRPSTSTCFLIGISNHAYTVVVSKLSILDPGPNEWSTHSTVIPSRYFEARDSSLSTVLFQDAFYFLDKNGNLTRLNLEENNRRCRFEFLREPKTPCDTTCQQNFLVECGGELLSIFVGHMGKWIHVYKLNFGKRVWETVTSLNGHSLYLTQSSSFSLEATPGLHNRIYFPRYRDGGTVFYSLDRAEWNFFGSQQEALCDLYDTQLQHHSCWIKPSWS